MESWHGGMDGIDGVMTWSHGVMDGIDGVMAWSHGMESWMAWAE